eukprot:7603765-Heterocapsa_arctica.AAC.1
MVDQLHDSLQHFVGGSRVLVDEAHGHDALHDVALVLDTQPPDLRVLDILLQDLCVHLVAHIFEHDVADLEDPGAGR